MGSECALSLSFCEPRSLFLCDRVCAIQESSQADGVTRKFLQARKGSKNPAWQFSTFTQDAGKSSSISVIYIT